MRSIGNQAGAVPRSTRPVPFRRTTSPQFNRVFERRAVRARRKPRPLNVLRVPQPSPGSVHRARGSPTRSHSGRARPQAGMLPATIVRGRCRLIRVAVPTAGHALHSPFADRGTSGGPRKVVGPLAAALPAHPPVSLRHKHVPRHPPRHGHRWSPVHCRRGTAWRRCPTPRAPPRHAVRADTESSRDCRTREHRTATAPRAYVHAPR